jgi:ATP-dependent Clp protease ATP-binding subunit ClpC
VEIGDKALEAAAKLADRYITDRYLPDKAIDLIDEAASRVRLRYAMPPTQLRQLKAELEQVERDYRSLPEQDQYLRAYPLREKIKNLQSEIERVEREWREARETAQIAVTEDEVAQIVQSWTGIPVTRLVEAETQKLLRMEEELHKRVIGQQEAIGAVSRAVRRARSGLKDPKRPTGSFIFLGPTGVGKTELARALAQFLFDSEDSLIRIDMSEYQERFNVSRLVGAPPGYVGYEEGGQLTEAVRRKPYSVVLLDEIEKAHPEVFNVLLQVLDDGRLTDSQGRIIDFKNTVIIMTSNVGAREIGERSVIGFGERVTGGGRQTERQYESMRNRVMEELKRTFRPEFLNRIDDVIVFHPLTQEEIQQIVTLMLAIVNRQVEQQSMRLEVTQAAREILAREGWDPNYGARPLRRAIQRLIEDPLSEEVLLGRFSAGDTILAEGEDGKIIFRKMDLPELPDEPPALAASAG